MPYEQISVWWSECGHAVGGVRRTWPHLVHILTLVYIAVVMLESLQKAAHATSHTAVQFQA